MKLNEIILAATEKDLAGCDADSILARAKQMPARRKLAGWKKALIVAAAACLFVGTASAAVLLSGFGTVFERPVDPGHVEVLDASANNGDVVWNITETWFDDHVLHIGGAVTTPEPLDPNGEYMVLCYFKEPGATTHHALPGYIFPSGGRESAFIFSGRTRWGDEDTSVLTGLEDGEITLELRICYFHDVALVPETGGHIADYVIIPGEWRYTVHLESRDKNIVGADGRYESLWPNESLAVVTSVRLTAFSLEIMGEDLTYTYHTKEGSAKDSSLQIWLKMKDGTLLFKPRGIFANQDGHVWQRRCTDESIILLFGQPIDPTEVESVILYEGWGTTATNPAAEEFYLENGWEFYPSVDDVYRTELWLPLIEIPLN